jgi:poly(A) polymerase
MKHTSTLSREFLKHWWQSLSSVRQKSYLRLHPGSKLKLTSNKEAEAVKLLQSIVRKSKFRHKVFLAGGAVRDELLGRQSKDIDITVADLNGGIMLAKYVSKKLGIREPVIFPTFGTAKIQLKSGVEIEFVQTRNEEYVKGSRKPRTSYGTIQEDVERRDFTMNSLLKDLTTGKVLDLTGKGLQDLKAGVIRTPLDPHITFSEDPLRMLRAVRFATTYNFKLADDVMPAIKDQASELQSISKERIHEELNKILRASKPSRGMQMLKDSGLLQQFMPELVELAGVQQGKYHKADAWQHTMDVLDLTEPKLINRLAALLHDVGKPKTRTVTDTDVHFYEHEKVSGDMAREILTRLKYSTSETETVAKLVSSHMRTSHTGQWSNATVRRYIRDMGDVLPEMLDLAMADRRSHVPEHANVQSLESLAERIKQLQKEAPVKDIKLPITGHEIMQVLNVKPGPVVGQAIAFLTDQMLEDPNMTKDQAIEQLKKSF